MVHRDQERQPMIQFLKRFVQDEDGAITVDFVVLTAAMIFMVMGIFTIITPSLYENVAVGIDAKVDEAASR
jgi:Flp pilus assembly protein TadG